MYCQCLYLFIHLFFYPHLITPAVSNAHQLLLDNDRMKKVHEILEEAQAMVKANVSDLCLGNGNVRYSSCIIVWKGWK